MDLLILGERIRQARERLGYSQTELGRLISKDQRAVSEYEHGERRIWVNDLPALAEALEVPILYFFEGDITPEDIEQHILTTVKQLPNTQAKQDALSLLEWFIKALDNQ
ncbi:MAG: helix-turn-helix transcriptional regulator [Chloroflexota bacterium]